MEQESGIVSFPQGFPDTQAALNLHLQQAAKDKCEEGKRPKGLYPGNNAPDWNRIGQGVISPLQKLDKEISQSYHWKSFVLYHLDSCLM